MAKDQVFVEYIRGTGIQYLDDLDQLKTKAYFIKVTKDIINKNINNGVQKINYCLPCAVMIPIMIVSIAIMIPLNILLFPYGFIMFIGIFGSVGVMITWNICLVKKANDYITKTLEEIDAETHGCLRVKHSMHNLHGNTISFLKSGLTITVIDRIQQRYAQENGDEELLILYSDQPAPQKPPSFQPTPPNQQNVKLIMLNQPNLQPAMPNQPNLQPAMPNQPMHPFGGYGSSNQPNPYQMNPAMQNPNYAYQMQNMAGPSPNYHMGQHGNFPPNAMNNMNYKQSESLPTYELNLKQQGGNYAVPDTEIENFTEKK